MAEEKDVVIAVMGVTGAGKSTWISKVTKKNVHVGHGLRSDTSTVTAYDLLVGATNFILVDTPGFDDSHANDRVIVNKLLEWLETSYRRGTKLHGIIYMHRIIDKRIPGSALRNLRMFRKLCGDRGLNNVTLATTFWGAVNSEEGRKRELELTTTPDLWGNMIAKGCRVARLDWNENDNILLLHSMAKKTQFVMDAQREIVDEKISREQIATEVADNEKLAEERKRLQEKKQNTEKEMQFAFIRAEAERKERLLRERRQQEEEERRIADEARAMEESARWHMRRMQEELEKIQGEAAEREAAQRWREQQERQRQQREKEEHERELELAREERLRIEREMVHKYRRERTWKSITFEDHVDAGIAEQQYARLARTEKA